MALTAHALAGDRERCLEAGCDDYITKPVNSAQLREILNRYLGKATKATGRLNEPPQQTQGFPELLGNGILDPGTAERLMRMFLAELPERVAQIDTACRQGDRGMLIELAHQLKGATGMYGLDDIARTAQVIHQRATEDADLAELQAEVSELAELSKQALHCGHASGP